MGRLREIVVPMPRLPIQQDFAGRVEAVRSIQVQQAAALRTAEATFNALLAQVFQN